jgi:hypothetical protein
MEESILMIRRFIYISGFMDDMKQLTMMRMLRPFALMTSKAAWASILREPAPA